MFERELRLTVHGHYVTGLVKVAEWGNGTELEA
jgi:hypothetical protein